MVWACKLQGRLCKGLEAGEMPYADNSRYYSVAKAQKAGLLGTEQGCKAGTRQGLQAGVLQTDGQAGNAAG